MEKIVLYSTGCPKCNILIKKLKEANIKYETINDVDEIMKAGFEAVPVLSVNGEAKQFAEAVEYCNERIGK